MRQCALDPRAHPAAITLRTNKGNETMAERSAVWRMLHETRDLIHKPAHWCKLTYRTETGQYCLMGAMHVAGGARVMGTYGKAVKAVRLEIAKIDSEAGRVHTCHNSITSYNDDSTTTHEDVLALLERTILTEEARP